MKGTCATCQAKQAEGIEDYCCVLCVVDKALPGLPSGCITKQEDGTTVIDLSKAWGRP